MNQLMLRGALAGVCGAAAAGLFAQSGAAPRKVDVVAVAGCVVQEGTNWFLTNATEPLVASPPARGVEEGSLAASLGVTIEFANRQPPGKARYRLTGFLDEFALASRKGYKALVRGPLITDAKEKRLNVMSVAPVTPACDSAK